MNSEIVEGGDIWRLAINHRTIISYPEVVTASYNEVRIQPGDEPGQAVLSSWLELDPFEGVQAYVDYFGSRVSAFDLHRPHQQLIISAATTVETFTHHDQAPALSWDELAASGCEDRFEEFLAATPLTEMNDELAAMAHQIREESATPTDAGRAVCAWVHKTLTYESGATHIHTSAVDAFNDRRGVCQDLSHLTIGMLRSIAVPTRYVSGYLHPDEEAPIGVTVTGQSHAWVEWWDGRWTAFDPTNAKPTGLGHVVTGRGRDYRDTPPVRGVYAGPEAIGNEVNVQITRLR